VLPVRILVTGATGCLGRHLCRALQHTPTTELLAASRSLLNLRDHEQTQRVVQQFQPQQIYHLAGNIHAGRGNNTRHRDAWEDNLKGTLNLLDACLSLAEKPRLLFASTGAIYGEGAGMITETTLLKPLNSYAASKAAADLAVFQYFASFGLPTIRARLFNYLAAGQDDSTALSRFARQLTELKQQAERGAVPVLNTGSLDAERDFLDVQDMVEALILLMQQGQPGEAYNVASGTSQPMRWFLDRLIKLSGMRVQVESTPDPLRKEARHLRVEATGENG
jgi:GDP-4-dehydro-6-deoxy-D-mannose reductase